MEQADRGSAADGGPTAVPHTEARVTVAGAGQHRPISALFARRPKLPHADHPEQNTAVEGPTAERTPDTAAAGDPGPNGDAGDPRTLHQAADERQQGSDLGESSAAVRGGDLALSPMGSDAEEVADHALQDPYYGGGVEKSIGE